MKGLDRRVLLRGWVCCALLATLDFPRAEDARDGPAWPQPEAEQFHVTTWTSRQGLPEDWIECITQTSDGYLWLGTPKGLIRFDGVAFLMLNEENCPAMKSTVCKALLEDAGGNLWVATKKGVLRFGPDGVKRFGVEHGLGGEETSSLALGRDGAVWIGTEAGVTQWLEGRFNHFPAKEQSSPFVYSVFEDREGRLWAGMMTGLFQVDPGSGTYAKRWGRDTANDDPAHETVRCLLPAKKGGFWVGNDFGLCVWPQGRGDVERIGDTSPAHRVKGVIEDRRGQLWAVIGYVLHRYVGRNFIPVESAFGLSDAIVNAIYEDRQDNLWIGSRHGGLTRAKPVPARVVARRDGLWNLSVRSVSPRRAGGVWFACASGAGWVDGDGLHRLPLEEPWETASLSCVLEDPVGRLWLGTMERGMAVGRAHPPLGPWYHPRAPDGCRALLADAGTNLWAGFSVGVLCAPPLDELLHFPRGEWWEPMHSAGAWLMQRDNFLVTGRKLLWFFDAGRWNQAGSPPFEVRLPHELAGLGYDWLNQVLPKNRPSCFDVRALASAADGTTWIGTASGGLEQWKEQTFHRVGKDRGLPSDAVNALLTDAEGVTWVGTSAGLACLRGDEIRSLAPAGGPLALGVQSLVEDGAGCLWVGTEAGLYRFSREELVSAARGATSLAEVRFMVLDETDGLLATVPSGGGQPAACRTPDGQLWFATSHGLVTVEPGPFAVQDSSPPAQVEEVRTETLTLSRLQPWIRAEARSQALPRDRADLELRLPPGSGGQLEFRYTALDLRAPERIQFAYRLVGNDQNWIQAGNRRTASYMNLRPGRYRFEVAAADRHASHRAWKPEATLSVVIEPYLHQTLWFRSVAILGGGLALSGLVGWRWRDLRRRHALEQRLAVAEERSRIADDLHDEIGANLSRMTREFATRVPGVEPFQADKLKHELRSVMSDLDQIVWLLQPEQDTLPHFADQLHRLADRWFAEGDTQRHWRVPDDLPPIPLAAPVRRDLLLFVKETLTNILKHAAAHAVGLDLSLDADALTLIISDDGQGFDPESAGHSGHGLASLARRAERLGGKLSIESKPGAGSRVHLCVPRSCLAGEKVSDG